MIGSSSKFKFIYSSSSYQRKNMLKAWEKIQKKDDRTPTKSNARKSFIVFTVKKGTNGKSATGQMGTIGCQVGLILKSSSATMWGTDSNCRQYHQLSHGLAWMKWFLPQKQGFEIKTSFSYMIQGCYISQEICLFPGRWEILGNTGKYKISNNGLLVGPVVGVLTHWKLIKLGTKTHYRSK